MAYEMSGTPVVMGTGSEFGGGNLGSLLIGALLFGGGFGGFGGRGVAGADLAATAGLQNQINSLADQISTQGLNSEIDQLQSQFSAANIANLQGIASNAQLYQSGNATIASAIERGNFTTLQSLNAQNLQTLNSFNNLTTTTLQGFNELGRDNANAFNQVQMGLNALSAQQAACCCDIKTAIHADGEATRALINATNMATLQAQLSDAKSKINTLEIINTLKPVVTV